MLSRHRLKLTGSRGRMPVCVRRELVDELRKKVGLRLVRRDRSVVRGCGSESEGFGVGIRVEERSGDGREGRARWHSREVVVAGCLKRRKPRVLII